MARGVGGTSRSGAVNRFLCYPMSIVTLHEWHDMLQVFSSNMSKKTEPKITNCKPSDNWTSITFKPDLAKFGMETLESDVAMLMRKRVFDMAGVLGKTVKASKTCCILHT